MENYIDRASWLRKVASHIADDQIFDILNIHADNMVSAMKAGAFPRHDPVPQRNGHRMFKRLTHTDLRSQGR